MIREKQLDAVPSLLAFLDKHGTGDPNWKALMTSIRTELLMAKDQWPAAADLVRQAGAELPDASLAGLLAGFLDRCAEAGQWELSDGFPTEMLDRTRDKPSTREVAARAWVNGAEARRNAKLTLQRMQDLSMMQVGTPTMIRLVEDAYRVVMDAGTNDDIRAYVNLCDSLLSQVGTEPERNALKGFMMDGDFRLEDYAGTLKLLEDGFPGQSRSWQDMMINKVKAHLALKEGRNKEAVERFQKFMQYVQAEAMDQTDPVTGIRVTKEAILGLNAKRIGDIFASMGEKEEARKAYATARDKYRAALERARGNTNEYGSVEEELKKIPSE